MEATPIDDLKMPSVPRWPSAFLCRVFLVGCPLLVVALSYSSLASIGRSPTARRATFLFQYGQNYPTTTRLHTPTPAVR